MTGTGVYAIEYRLGVFLCLLAHLVPGSPEAAIAAASPATKALLVDRQARGYRARTGGAR